MVAFIPTLLRSFYSIGKIEIEKYKEKTNDTKLVEKEFLIRTDTAQV